MFLFYCFLASVSVCLAIQLGNDVMAVEWASWQYNANISLGSKKEKAATMEARS